jgi:cation transporter-like permease
MSNTEQHTSLRLIVGLRRTAFATIAALLVEYGFGLFLFGTTPESAHDAGLLAAFGATIASGPAALIIHAILGTAIVLGGAMSLVRAIQTRAARIITLNLIAAIAIVLAWLAGADTANDPMGPAGRVMGITTGIAILAYALVLFIAPKPNVSAAPAS